MEIFIYIIIGAIAGLVRALISGKGLIPLPRMVSKKGHKFVNLGFLAPMVLGAVAGWLAPATLGINGVVACMAAYSGAAFIENLVERAKRLPELRGGQAQGLFILTLLGGFVAGGRSRRPLPRSLRHPASQPWASAGDFTSLASNKIRWPMVSSMRQRER